MNTRNQTSREKCQCPVAGSALNRNMVNNFNGVQKDIHIILLSFITKTTQEFEILPRGK